METREHAGRLRIEWFVGAVNRCQEFVMAARVTDRDAFVADVDRLLETIGDPINAVERELLNGVLFQIAICGARHFDALYHRAAPCSCRFEADSVSAKWAPRLAHESLAQFRAWAGAFAVSLEDRHLVAPEYRARAIIDRTFTGDLALDELARAVGVNSASLRIAFRRTFGMTPSEYRKRVRIAAALRLLSQGMPVKSAANDVGFLSRSKFYASFKRLTGTLPAAIRSLEPRAVERLCERVEADLRQSA